MTGNKYFMAPAKKPMTPLVEVLERWSSRLRNPAGCVSIVLADSAPLFRAPLLERVAEWLAAVAGDGRHAVQGIYLGAANGDEPAFYEIAEAFFSRVGIAVRQHWKAGQDTTLPPAQAPTLVILAGGSVDRGWPVLHANPWRDWLREDAAGGRLLIGISAGAIHLMGGLNDQGEPCCGLQPSSSMVCVHEERYQWPSLQRLLQRGVERVLCVPSGAGVVMLGATLFSVCGEPFTVSPSAAKG